MEVHIWLRCSVPIGLCVDGIASVNQAVLLLLCVELVCRVRDTYEVFPFSMASRGFGLAPSVSAGDSAVSVRSCFAVVNFVSHLISSLAEWQQDSGTVTVRDQSFLQAG